MCSKAIIDIISIYTTPKSSEKMMFKQYLTAVKVTLGHAVEEMTGKRLPGTWLKKIVLSFFNNEVENIRNASGLKSIIEIKNFIREISDSLAEEDLGGVSELFSGHMAIWKEGEVVLTHNPARRGAGKIYTPFDVTNYMYQYSST